MISTCGGTNAPTGAWTSYTSSAVAPADAWSVTVVLGLSGSCTTVQFDNVVLSSW